MYRTAKRGRPQKHYEGVDKGTVELQQKRKKLLESDLNSDPTLTESLLGVLYARQMISRSLYEAGCFFGELGYKYKPCLGYTFRQRANVLVPKIVDLSQLEEGSFFLSDYEIRKRTKAWTEALQALKQAGQLSYQMVLKVVFYDEDLYTYTFSNPLKAEIKTLKRGLNELHFYFKGERKGKKGRLFGQAENPSRATNFQPFLGKSPHPSLHGYPDP